MYNYSEGYMENKRKSLVVYIETWKRLMKRCIDSENSIDEEINYIIDTVERVEKEDGAKRVCRAV